MCLVLEWKQFFFRIWNVRRRMVAFWCLLICCLPSPKPQWGKRSRPRATQLRQSPSENSAASQDIRQKPATRWLFMNGRRGIGNNLSERHNGQRDAVVTRLWLGISLLFFFQFHKSQQEKFISIAPKICVSTRRSLERANHVLELTNWVVVLRLTQSQWNKMFSLLSGIERFSGWPGGGREMLIFLHFE